MFLKIGKNNNKNSIHLVVFWIAVVLLVSVLCLLTVKEAWSSDREDTIDLSRKIKVPSQDIIDMVLSGKSGDGIVSTNKDPLFNGTQNTFYRHALDMPLTRFILGNVELNADGLSTIFDAENSRRSAAGGSGSGWSGGGVSGGKNSLIQFDAAPISQVSQNSVKVFRFLLGPLGAILLGISFMAQVVMIGYNGLMHDRGFSVVPIQAVVFRLIIFLLAIGFFRVYTTALITYSNSIANIILPMEAQTHLMGVLTTSSATITDGDASIGSLIGSFFRILAYVCVRILIIMRDVLMALTLVTGTTCFALGYFSTYGNHEPMREYLSGWIKNFMTMLLWGPFAALVLNAMGIVSILTSAGEVSSVASGIFGLASLFAAKDIPKMSEEFGNIALASLLGMIAPAVSKMTVGGAGAATILAGSGVYRGARGAARGVAAGLKASPAPIAGTMGGTHSPSAPGTTTSFTSMGRGGGSADVSPKGMADIAPTIGAASSFASGEKDKDKKSFADRFAGGIGHAVRKGATDAQRELEEEQRKESTPRA